MLTGLQRINLSRRPRARRLLAMAGFSVMFGLALQANGQVLPFSALTVPPNSPPWLPPTWHNMLAAPLPGSPGLTPGVPLFVPQLEVDGDATGQTGTYQPGGATYTPANAFFQSLGTNGRACITCHLPSSGMGLSLTNIQSRYITSFGSDPLFAPVDGATCPSNVPQSLLGRSPLGALLSALGGGNPASAYYALLNRGLIRIPRPVPANAQYTVAVVSDPFGCNTNPIYNQVANSNGSTQQILSVYRRPIMAAGMNFKVDTGANTGAFPPIDPLSGVPLPRDSQGNIENGNLMWDGREATLSTQAVDATLTHAQALKAPTAAQVAQIVAFETGVFSAQIFDNYAGTLTGSGELGGPVALSQDPPGTFPPPGTPTMNLYNGLSKVSAATSPQLASIYRGQEIFNNGVISINNVAGLNNIAGLPNPLPGACTTCHSQINIGAADVPVGEVGTGIGGDSAAFGGPAPASDLPIFRVTCLPGYTMPYHGTAVLTNDPGLALTTGKCSDVGRMMTPNLRALAARPPYFHDGSGSTLLDVVNFYNQRFNINYTAQQKQDLVNFLSAL